MTTNFIPLIETKEKFMSKGFEDNNHLWILWGCSEKSWCGALFVFFSQLFVNLRFELCFFVEFNDRIFWRIMFWVETLCGAAGTFYLRQNFERDNSTRSRFFIYLLYPSETKKLKLIYIWLKIATFLPQFDAIWFFFQNSQLLHFFAESLNLEIINSIIKTARKC